MPSAKPSKKTKDSEVPNGKDSRSTKQSASKPPKEAPKSSSTKNLKSSKKEEEIEYEEDAYIPRMTLWHCTHYRGKYLTDKAAKPDEDLPDFDAVWWQATPGGLSNSQACCWNYGPRHIKLGPKFFNDWADNSGKSFALYLVDEQEGRKKSHYFYKFVLVVMGSEEHKNMSARNKNAKNSKKKNNPDWKVSCVFSDCRGKDGGLFRKLQETAFDYWGLGEPGRNHVHIGFVGFEDLYVGWQGLDDDEWEE